MSEKNDVGDAEAYQEELSEQVEDGGGCAETWAALAENRENNISRRSVLRGVGGTAGVALANTVGILSPVEASEGKSQETLEIVEASKGFQAIRGQIQSILEKDDAVSNKNKGDYFTSRKVQKPDAEEVSFLISSHTGSFQNEELDVDISVEISAMVDEKKVKQVKGLIKRKGADEKKYTSIAHDSSGLEQESVTFPGEDSSKNIGIFSNQVQCIPCNYPQCESTCVAVWDTICNNKAKEELCSNSYTTYAACLIIGAYASGPYAAAACGLFLAAICEGDISCFDTPEAMCDEVESACGDGAWVN